jgi:hypothetical protein
MLLLAATFLFLIIVPGEALRPPIWRAVSAPKSAAVEFEHGWPWVFLRRRATLPITPSIRPPAEVLPWMHPWAWSFEGETTLPPAADARPISRTVLGWWPAAAVVDAVAAVVVLMLLAWALERRHRRRKLWQFSLAELFLATIVLSCGLAWWLQNARVAEIEERSMIGKAQRSEYLGPLWLRRIAGADRLQPLQHITSMDLVSLPLEPLHGLGNQFPYLQTLSVSLLQENEDDLREIGRLRELRTLTIRAGALVTDNDLMQLASLKKLQYFEATGLHNISSDGIRFISKLKQLKSLLLVGVPIGERGMSVIGGCRQLEKLLLDEATYRGADDSKGLGEPDPLRNLATLTRLRELVLVDGVRNRDLVYIAPLTKLERLALFQNHISDEGIKHLIPLKKLKRLEMRNTSISTSGIDQLRRELPNCAVDILPHPLR